MYGSAKTTPNLCTMVLTQQELSSYHERGELEHEKFHKYVPNLPSESNFIQLNSSTYLFLIDSQTLAKHTSITMAPTEAPPTGNPPKTYVLSAPQFAVVITILTLAGLTWILLCIFCIRNKRYKNLGKHSKCRDAQRKLRDDVHWHRHREEILEAERHAFEITARLDVERDMEMQVLQNRNHPDPPLPELLQARHHSETSTRNGLAAHSGRRAGRPLTSNAVRLEDRDSSSASTVSAHPNPLNLHPALGSSAGLSESTAAGTVSTLRPRPSGHSLAETNSSLQSSVDSGTPRNLVVGDMTAFHRVQQQAARGSIHSHRASVVFPSLRDRAAAAQADSDSVREEWAALNARIREEEGYDNEATLYGYWGR